MRMEPKLLAYPFSEDKRSVFTPKAFLSFVKKGGIADACRWNSFSRFASAAALTMTT